MKCNVYVEREAREFLGEGEVKEAEGKGSDAEGWPAPCTRDRRHELTERGWMYIAEILA